MSNTPATLVEKIIARAAGVEAVSPGEIVTCQVDLAMILDSGGPRRIWPRLKELGVAPGVDREELLAFLDAQAGA